MTDISANLRTIQCRTELQALRDKYGYSIFFSQCRSIMRSRLQIDPDARNRRKRFTSAVYNRLYRRQRGICPLCNLAMVKPNNFPGGLEMDHINPNEPDFNGINNLQLTHEPCNRKKGAKSIQQQSKETGKLIDELIRVPVDQEEEP